MIYIQRLVLASSLFAGFQGAAVDPFEQQPELVRSSWTKVARSDQEALIRLQIVLSNPNVDAFEERAIQIATPFSPFYRKHLTNDQLAEWVKPPAHAVHNVQNWLLSHSIKSSIKHDIIQADVSIAHAEALLNATYFVHQDVRSGSHRVDRSAAYYVPEHLHKFIETITPTVNFPNLPKPSRRFQQEFLSSRSQASSSLTDLAVTCDQYTEPRCVRKFYNVTYTPPIDTNVTVAITIGYSGPPNISDLQIFLKNFYPRAAKAHPQPVYIQYENSKMQDVIEESLDVQTVYGQSYPVEVVFAALPKGGFGDWGPYSIGANHPKEIHRQEDIYLSFFHAVAHNATAGASTTESQSQVELDLTPRYMRYICRLWARLGTRGVSVFFPSGDGGADSGRNAVLPAFPCTCPFITCLGATVYDKGIEKAATRFTYRAQHDTTISGGGFSYDVFPTPAYQKKDVQTYLKRTGIAKSYKNVKRFNASGRGYPDVAAFGAKIPVVIDAEITRVGGTSASSPMFAALVAVINAYEESKGRPPVGFVNPWLYMHPYLLNDITKGGNNAASPKDHGYPVTEGWDAVTGLGSPNVGKMLEDLDDIAEQMGM